MNSRPSHIRHGRGSVRPYLHGALDLPAFLGKVFGAKELERHEFGPRSFHVELQIGDSVVVVEAGDLPADVQPWTGSVYVYVDDADAAYAGALALGARSVAAMTDKPYQERQGAFADSTGNTWWVATFRKS
jgi:PhnB protein